MLPPGFPDTSNSDGERLLFRLLRENLDDTYTVVHSVPWLSAAARELAGKSKAVTGEIDFLIIHADLGVLALEVKGGIHRVKDHTFVYLATGNISDPIQQVRTGTHALARWIGSADSRLRLRIGYAIAFPHSDFDGAVISSALTDVTVSPPETIVIDRPALLKLGARIPEIMRYWKSALSNPSFGADRMASLVRMICPEVDGTPTWRQRQVWDNRLWLALTPEQSRIAGMAMGEHRLLINGWPGTGKTLILVECARRALQSGKSVLILTFNVLLAEHLRRQIDGDPRLRISTWHSFCGAFAQRSPAQTDPGRIWLDDGCRDDVRRAALTGVAAQSDVVLIDEGQAFRRSWLEWLRDWQGSNQLQIFCDETQVFDFEKSRATLAEIESILGATAFTLTIQVRSPGAVFQRLTAARRPRYQVQSPRDAEPDTLQERLVSQPFDALEDVLTSLSAKFDRKDIVVLTKFGSGQTSKSGEDCRFETVSRFRGLESPVVIVWFAEQMTDAELFCAYSRATTLCIVLYNAEVLGVRGPSGEFERLLLDHADNRLCADRARTIAQTGEIIRDKLTVQWLPTRSIRMGWCESWRTWLVECHGKTAEFWIDYLATNTPWRTYHWDTTSIREIKHTPSVLPGAIASAQLGSFTVGTCAACGMLTPQSVLRGGERRCAMHDFDGAYADYGAHTSPAENDYAKIVRADDLLSAGDPTQLSADEKRLLPLSLAAGAALAFALAHPRRDLSKWPGVPGGRPLYRAAFALVYAVAYRQPSAKRVNVQELAAQLYARYLMPPGLTDVDWKKEIDLACGVAVQRGHLLKVEKGIYLPAT